MELLELFISFAKIGFTGFGGYSMLPLMNSEMLAHGWMNTSEISDIIVIAEMTPGPVGVNCATFAGIRAAGIPGAIAANLGILVPTLTLTLVAAIFFEKFKDSPLMRRILTGVRPACIGLICAVIVTLSMSNYIVNAGISWAAIGIGAVMIVALSVWKLSVPVVIIASAVLGILLT